LSSPPLALLRPENAATSTQASGESQRSPLYVVLYGFQVCGSPLLVSFPVCRWQIRLRGGESTLLLPNMSQRNTESRKDHISQVGSRVSPSVIFEEERDLTCTERARVFLVVAVLVTTVLLVPHFMLQSHWRAWADGLVLSPTSGGAGTSVTVSGLDYQGTTCGLSSAPSGLFSSSYCSISAGTLTGGFTVTATGASGSYTVTVTTNAGESGTASFYLITDSTHTLSLNPTSGPVGTAVSGLTTGFTTDTSCLLSAAPSAILSSASCTITGGGNASIEFTVSSIAPIGSYTILVVGNTGTSASATFTVTEVPTQTFTLSPTMGVAGTVVAASGSNYAGSMCTLSSSPSGLMSSSSCVVSGGTLTGVFTVESSARLGCYVVTVTTDVPGETRSAAFCITATSTAHAGVITLTVAPAGAGMACGPGPTCTTGAAVAFYTSTFPGAAIFSIWETYDGHTFQYWQVDGANTSLPESGWSPWSSYPAWFSNLQQSHTVVAVFKPPAEPPAQAQPQPEQLPGCVIATAAYGSDMAPEVAYMRYVRDNLIGSTSIGRALRDGFLIWYYWWSPPVAQYISDKPALQAIFRFLLAPVSVSVRIADGTFHAIGGGSLGSLLAFALAAIFSILSYIVFPSVLLVVPVRWVRRTLGHAVSSRSPA